MTSARFSPKCAFSLTFFKSDATHATQLMPPLKLSHSTTTLFLLWLITLDVFRPQDRIHCLGISIIRNRQIFLGGPRTKMKNWLEIILRAGIPKFFACGGLFFVVETLKTAKKPLIFQKRDPAAAFSSEKLVGRFYEIGRSLDDINS